MSQQPFALDLCKVFLLQLQCSLPPLYVVWLSSAFPQPPLIRRQNLQTKAARPRCSRSALLHQRFPGWRWGVGLSLFPLRASTADASGSQLLRASGGPVTCFSHTTTCYQFTRTHAEGEGWRPFPLPGQTNACNYDDSVLGPTDVQESASIQISYS